MKIIFLVILLFLTALFLYFLYAKRYINPYKLHMYIGRKGSGKSTLMHKQMYKDFRNGKKVYSNMEFNTFIKGVEYVAEIIDPNIIDTYDIEPDSTIYIDEVNTYWDNRNFKNMPPSVLMWFRYQRHSKVRVNLYSQTFDIDKKLRSLTDEFHVVSKFALCLVFSRRLIMKPVVVHPEGDAPARIADDFLEDPPFFAIFGGIQLAWIPHWSKLFDSFSEYRSERKVSDQQLPILPLSSSSSDIAWSLLPSSEASTR